MIDVLAVQPKNDGEKAALTLIVTADTRINPDIIKYADERNVVLFAALAGIDDETGEFVVSEKYILANGKSYGSQLSKLIDLFRKLNGNFDEYKGVDPKNYINGSTEKNDPDPAQIDDK